MTAERRAREGSDGPDPHEPGGPTALIELIDRWEPRRIGVIGDFMLDRASYGNVDRLTPDAPVPVLAIQREESNAEFGTWTIPHHRDRGD